MVATPASHQLILIQIMCLHVHLHNKRYLVRIRWSAYKLSRDARKTVFGVYDQMGQKSACKVTEAG